MTIRLCGGDHITGTSTLLSGFAYMNTAKTIQAIRTMLVEFVELYRNMNNDATFKRP